jgi:DNA-directed RNA polymerase subunit RPC12/RpoP
MDQARGIGKLSFRSWYERQLIESHVWLVSCILCALGAAALANAYLTFHTLGLQLLLTVAAMYVSGLTCWYTWRRYRALMAEAQQVAEASTCSACGAQGEFDVVAPVRTPMSVACRKCGHRWVVR